MKIRSVKAIGYIPLKFLKGITHFEMKFESIYQSIIGTNGSGKSSVLRLLSGLPPHHSEFAKGGYYEVVTNHRGFDYTVSCDYSAKPKFSFLKHNGTEFEELNPGHTPSVQFELCEKIFGMTPALFDILIGETKFSQMLSVTRRDWLMRLSGGDMGFAMQSFKKLKTHQRDLCGAIKMINHRIANESNNLTSDEDLEISKRTCSELKDLLSFLMEEKKPNLPQTQDVQDQRQNMLAKFIRVGGQVSQLNGDKPACLTGMMDTDQVNDFLKHLKFQKENLTNQNNQLSIEIEHVQSCLQALLSSNAGSIEELKQHVADLRARVDTILAGIELIDYQPNHYDYEQAFDGFYTDLINCYSEMPQNVNGRYSKDQLLRAEASLKEIHLSRARAQSIIQRSAQEIDSLSKIQHSECPSCGFSWVPGQHELHIIEQRRVHDEAVNALNELDRQSFEHSEYIDLARAYRHFKVQINQIVSIHPRFSKLWDIIDGVERTTASNTEIVNVIQYCRTECGQMSLAYKLIEEINRYDKSIQHSLELGDAKGSIHDEALQQLTDRWESTRQSIVNVNGMIQEVETFLRAIKHMESMVGEMNLTIAKLETLTLVQVDCIRNDIISKGISEFQSILAHRELELQRAMSAKGIVDNLKAEKISLEARHDACKRMVDELNPIDGLIADEMKGFIQSFVDELNEFIKGIWEHDLKLVPCGSDSGELDYKFPLSVNGNAPTTPDIGVKTSQGQRDVADLAFRLAIYAYLDMYDYPLYLDELAPSFDEQHRFNIMNFVKAYVESSRCSQMFMISHYVGSHGVFTNAEVCIMDESNLIHKPEVFNQHVIAR